MRHRGVDYEGDLATRYEAGRHLGAEKLATWTTAVAPFLPDAGAIVDIGAGTGRFARPLADLSGGPVIAIEPATRMRDRRIDDGVIWLGGTAEALPLAGASVGLVWSAFTTHYLDLASAGAEMARVLAPGGRVLIWHAFPDRFDELEWLRWFPAARAIDERRMPSVERVVAALGSGGLRLCGRTDHRVQTAADLAELADRLQHRAISTLTLISDSEFDAGLERLRAAAARPEGRAPVYATNTLLEFAADAGR